jgi:hypothetical protein
VWLRDEFVALVPGRAVHPPLLGAGVDSGA